MKDLITALNLPTDPKNLLPVVDIANRLVTDQPAFLGNYSFALWVALAEGRSRLRSAEDGKQAPLSVQLYKPAASSLVGLLFKGDGFCLEPAVGGHESVFTASGALKLESALEGSQVCLLRPSMSELGFQRVVSDIPIIAKPYTAGTVALCQLIASLLLLASTWRYVRLFRGSNGTMLLLEGPVADT